MPTEDRRVGKLLPFPVTPETFVCFSITVPNAVQYRAALMGQLSALGEWYTWDHPTDGTVCIDCEEAAQIWRNAIANASFSDEECTPAMDCATLASMIDSCEEVRDAIIGVIQGAIGNNPAFQSAFADWFLADEYIRDRLDERYNVPVLTDAVSSGNMLKPDQCLDDYIFNQCVTLVELLDAIARDIFDAIEVGTNQLERWAIVTSAVPATGQVIPVDEGLQFVDQLIEEIAEDYNGAFDVALKNEIACDIFCIAKEGCTLSLDQAIAYYESKVGALSLEDPVSLLQDIVTFINNGDFPGDLPVYLMHLLSLALMKLAQNVFGIDFVGLYMQVIASGDEPNNDWELLCEECQENCVPGSNCGNPYVIDSRGIVVCQDEQFVDIELTPLLGNYTCRIGFDVVADCTFNGWEVIEGTFTVWEQFPPYMQGVRFIGQNPTVDSGDPNLTGFQPTQILFFSETPCTIRCSVS